MIYGSITVVRRRKRLFQKRGRRFRFRVITWDPLLPNSPLQGLILQHYFYIFIIILHSGLILIVLLSIRSLTVRWKYPESIVNKYIINYFCVSLPRVLGKATRFVVFPYRSPVRYPY